MIRTLADKYGIGTAHNLVSGVSEGRRKTSISTRTSKISTGQITRVIREELENAYFADPIEFGGINKNVQMIMSAGYTWKVNDADKKDFMDFLDNLGKIGEDYTVDELLEYSFWSPMIFGMGYIENVFNEKDDRIVDLTRVDSKTMDYARTTEGNIVLDESSKPIGYVQKTSITMTQKEGGDEVPEAYKNSVDLSDGGRFLLAKRIALFKLFPASNGFDAFGLVEPAYKSILRKLNIEEAQTNSIYARGTYPLVDYVGSDKIPATPQRLEQALKILSKFKHDRYFALPYYHKIEPIEVRQSDIVDQTIKGMRENQSASLGLPLAFATGAGESTNRATLNNQQAMTQFTLQDIVKKTIANWEKFILKPIAKQRGYKEVPKLIWNTIGTEDWDEKSKRLQDWVQLGVLSAMDVRSTIIKMESLPIDEDSEAPEKEELEPKEVEDGKERKRFGKRDTTDDEVPAKS